MKPKSRPKNHMTVARSVGREIPTDEILKMTPVPQEHIVSTKPSVEILKCISFQKFRYSGENRPGKKYQEKEFMTLGLYNLADKVVRVIIICTDADNRELIHPNGLVGRDCHHGIYDKEYPVTENDCRLKIPYLRTERIKINAKKDEHKNTIQANNIQAVLSQRASHLPSPYKERCLSQCTDKYTSARKFDTTKVCLGVIITVVASSGEYNGSLHAISHMVRNASEKTSLAIHKLSETNISAWEGGVVDIFTNEEGPAMEPDKCLVYVTLPDFPGAERWKSEVFTPNRDDILYKKVITYEVPPIAPNYDISTPTPARLHLELPQSNQYCCIDFVYVPLDNSAGYVCIDHPILNNNKRPHGEDEDVKPELKKLRPDFDAIEKTGDSFKVNLKTKLQSRLDTSKTAEEGIQNRVQVRLSGDAHHIVTDNCYTGQKDLPQYTQEQHVYIRHEDPQTGEESYLLDMDANKKVNHSAHEILQTSNGNVSQLQAHPGDVKVVAAGYSDVVPPNTTVLIYTTNNGVTEQVAIGGTANEHMIIDGTGLVQASQGDYRDKENQQKVLSEQVVRRDSVALNQPTGLQTVGHKLVSDVATLSRPQYSYAMARSTPSIVPNTYNTSSLSPEGNKTTAVVSNLRRMVIPRKPMQETSPWEVGGPEDNEAYNFCAEAVNYTPQREVQQSTLAKTELVGSPYPAERELSSITGDASSHQGTLLQTANSNTVVNSSAPSQQGESTKNNLSSARAGVLSTTEAYLDGAVTVSNLPTFEVSQIADKLVNGLNSVDTEVTHTS